MYDHKNLLKIHEDVPADHYDRALKINLFQKFWHHRRFTELKRVVRPINGKVLDIGCHGGTFTKIILDKVGSKDVYGIDISHSAIKYIQKRIPYGHFQVATAEKLPYKDNFFEVVFCLEVLEHVDDPIAVITEIGRVLKNEGYGIILVPSDSKLFKIVWFLWTLYYPVWRHAHIQSFNGKKLEHLITNAGLKISRIKTFNFGMLKLIVLEKI